MSSVSGIPTKMKGVVCYAPGDYRMEALDVPAVGPEEVLVRVTAVGICAGDAKCYAGAPLFWGDKDREPYCQPPIVPGHEFIGEVVALGPGAAEKFSLELGDQAIAESIAPCWRCRYCTRGTYHMCMPHDIYGFHQRTPGAMAGYMKYISDSIVHKLEVAKKCGADVILNPGKCDVIAEVKKMTDGYGCDVYIEASGSPVSVKQGLHMIAKLGTFVEYSVFKNETSVDWTIIGDTKELNIHGGHLGYNTYPKAISMLANKELPIDDIITHQLPLADVVKGIDFVNSSSESIKVVLIPE
ncbi:erythritol/L-threitol dehydrogenase-like isoform X2 [Branchiostoma lanceolatum]|uniref:erythritol/L-threitol dehydrogenase-like isoform X2 n=1 Tax=Branchiostoma lanceolatum TaxID=7740 RepID=UPI00345640D6